MRYLSLLLLILCLSSCEYFDKKKVSSEEILQEELRTFNWNEVDEYPSFSECESAATKEFRKECFETTLANHILTSLQAKRMVVTKDLNDTIEMKFHISEKGEIKVLDMAVSDAIKGQIFEIETHLIESIANLPPIKAATKRGQPVKTEFKMPLVLQSE